MIETLGGGVDDFFPVDDSHMVFPDVNQKNLMTMDWSLTEGAAAHAVEIAKKVNDTPIETLNQDLVSADTQFRKDNSVLKLEEIAYNRADLLPDALKASIDENTKDQAIADSPLGVSYAWVNSLENTSGLSRTEKLKLASDHSMSMFYAKKFDEQSMFQVGMDFIGMMVVPDDGYNTSKAVSQANSNVSMLEGYLSSQEHINDLVAFRASLPVEARSAWDEKLKEIVGDTDDNVLQQLILSERLIGKDQFTDADLGIEAIGIGLTGMNSVLALGSAAMASFGKKMIRGMTALNRAKVMSEAGDIEKAAQLSDAAARDAGVASKLGIPRTEAQSVGSPLVTPEIKDDVLKGSPAGYSSEYRAYMDGVEGNLDYARDRIDIQLSLTNEEQGRLIGKIDKELRNSPDIEVVDIKATPEGIEIKYDWFNGEDDAVRVEEFRRFTIDDVGGLKEKEASLANALNPTASPNMRLGTDRDIFVQQAEMIIAGRSKALTGYTNAFKEAWKPVKGNKESVNNISNMLEALDGKPIVPTYDNLVNKGVGSLKLTDEEFKVFQGTRKILDDVFHTNNYSLRREMELKNIRNVKLGDKDHFAKVYDSPESARMGFGQAEETNVFIPSTGEVKIVNKTSELDEFLDKGFKLVKSDSKDPVDWFETGTNKVRFSLVKGDQISNLPERVLTKIPNYLPRVYNQANVFIQKARKLIVDGKARDIVETIAFARTEGQARKFILALEKAAAKAEKDVSYSMHFDKDPIVAGRITDDQMRIAGGQYRADRKVKELIDASESQGKKKVDLLDTLQQYMEYTARRVPSAEWRMNVQQRMLNEVMTDLPEARGRRFSELRGIVEASSLAQGRKSKLLTAIDQINGIMGVPTKAEQAMAGVLRSIGKTFDRAGKEKTAAFLYNYKDQSALNFLKGRAFNLNLGMFSIVQMPVQAFGAVMALAVDPKFAPRALNKWMMASLWDQGERSITADKAMFKLAQSLGENPNGFVKDWEFWRRSGMYDSVVMGNADFATMASGGLMDAGLLRRAYGTLEEKGQVFFKMGELANMRISFFTALERQKALDGAKFAFNDETLKRVMSRAEQYRMNMGAGNKAWFQRGVWSLPTQFKQIYTKFAEAMFGDWFTGKEKARVLLSQAALFGATGIPILNSFQDQIVDMFFDEGDLSQAELVTAKRGALGFLFNDVMDIDAVISGRMSLASDYMEDFEKLFSGDVSMVEGLMGVSYSLFGRGYDVIKTFSRATATVGHVPPEEWSMSMVEDALSDVGKSMIAMTASGRKALQAYDLAYADAYFSRNGQTLFQYPEGANMGTMIARGIGFTSQDLMDVYDLAGAIKTSKDKEKALSDQITSMLHNWSIATDAGDPIGAERASRALHFLRSQVDDYETRERIMKSVLDKMSSRQFDDKTFKDWINMRSSDLFNATGEFSVLATEKAKGDK